MDLAFACFFRRRRRCEVIRRFAYSDSKRNRCPGETSHQERDICKDLDPFDLLRALIGVSNMALPDWQQTACRPSRCLRHFSPFFWLNGGNTKLVKFSAKRLDSLGSTTTVVQF